MKEYKIWYDQGMIESLVIKKAILSHPELTIFLIIAWQTSINLKLHIVFDAAAKFPNTSFWVNIFKVYIYRYSPEIQRKPVCCNKWYWSYVSPSQGFERVHLYMDLAAMSAAILDSKIFKFIELLLKNKVVLTKY